MGFCLGNRGGGRKLIVKVINLIKKKIFNLTKMVNKTEDQIKIKKYNNKSKLKENKII